MFGIKFTKFDSMTHVIHYKNGKVKREGRGLSFWYFAPRSSITAIPLGSKDIQFIFNEITIDFQSVTVQGQISYKIVDPDKLAEVFDFTLNERLQYKDENFEKLNLRISNEAQTSAKSFIQNLNLREAIRSSREIEQRIRTGLSQSSTFNLLGVELLSIDVLKVSPTPEMSKALETQTRESLQKEADLAIYERRNFAVEQERKIKESELSTEIAVEEKRRQILEKQAESRFLEAENSRKLRQMQIDADIEMEERRKTLTELANQNIRSEADAKGYVLEKTLQPYEKLDWKTILAIGGKNSPAHNIALAFRELAENAQKVQNLNISPDLLQTLMHNQMADQGENAYEQQSYR